MTASTSAFLPIIHNSQLTSSLPSPPMTHYYHAHNDHKKTSPLFGVGGYRSGMPSDTRYTTQRRDVADLRSFLFNSVSDYKHKYHLPPIQNMMTTPTSSPSPPFECYASSNSPISSIASSPTPTEEGDDDFEQQQQQKQHLISIRRKGSIASILNSDPELKQLDEEESKCNYQSHFSDHYQTTLKRGRPRQDHIEIIQSRPPALKKQRRISSSLALNCVQQQQQQGMSTASPTINESPRATKGLRHFSKQVCDKVAEKGDTTYNEVADELALDIQKAVGNERPSCDQKNIRRRVYDALNVLMAMNIIAKDKKVIKWLGIPECYKQQANIDSDIQDNQVKYCTNSLYESDGEPSSKQLLMKQIEQEEARQNQLINSLNILRESVNNKLLKHLQIRKLVYRNQQTQIKGDQEINSSKRFSFPFFIVACPTTDDDRNDMVNSGQSAVISIHNDYKQQSHQIVYEDGEVLQYLLQQPSNADPLSTTIRPY